MKRIYNDTSLSHAILKSTAVDLRGDWPDARSYFDISQVRAPYRAGFFQDNQLRGLGVTQVEVKPVDLTKWIIIGSAAFSGYLIARKMFDGSKDSGVSR